VLSRDAEVDTKPQLEIDADDVKCSHGTTVGQLDPKQVFYLRSRGISEQNAKRMLCVGFAGEILEKLALDEVKAYVEKRVHDRILPATG
jgi:Fe-S cluster assembly protein SufD